MASVNVTEEDFGAVAIAAQDALGRSDRDAATALDKLARKINAALSNASLIKASPFGRMSAPLTWRDVPSTLTGG